MHHILHMYTCTRNHLQAARNDALVNIAELSIVILEQYNLHRCLWVINSLANARSDTMIVNLVEQVYAVHELVELVSLD
jgi:hypothetical protein